MAASAPSSHDRTLRAACLTLFPSSGAETASVQPLAPEIGRQFARATLAPRARLNRDTAWRERPTGPAQLHRPLFEPPAQQASRIRPVNTARLATRLLALAQSGITLAEIAQKLEDADPADDRL